MVETAPKRCIFCGSTGKMTDEHIWGQWVKSYVPRTANKHRFLDISVPRPGEHLPGVAKIRAGDPVNAKVTVVCAACNSGWMSHIQETAKSYLIPLFDGAWGGLDAETQSAIAKWVSMATMTAEHLSRDPVKITVSQAHRISDRKSTRLNSSHVLRSRMPSSA